MNPLNQLLESYVCVVKDPTCDDLNSCIAVCMSPQQAWDLLARARPDAHRQEGFFARPAGCFAARRGGLCLEEKMKVRQACPLVKMQVI